MLPKGNISISSLLQRSGVKLRRTDMVLGEILTRHAKHTPDRLAVVCKSSDTRCTYGQLNARVNRLAHAFTSWGVTTGSRVAILPHICVQY